MAFDGSALAAGGGSSLRKSGIEIVGDIQWGTHLCEFYAGKADLIATLVPYFKAGLEANEFCMWITSEPLTADEAGAALRKAVPDLDRFLAKGQIEILDYSQWYTLGGKFDADRVLEAWSSKLESALQRGFEGLRLTGNTFWLEQADWEDFTRYEAAVDGTIGSSRMLAMCTYAIEKCGMREILDVAANHQFALVREHNRWEVLQNVSRRRAEQALKESNARFRSLFDNMAEGYAQCEIVTDGAGEPRDFIFLEANPAFEQQTGLKRDGLLGKRVTEVLPGLEADQIKTYGRVAKTSQPVRFESYSTDLQRWYQVFAYCTGPGCFAAIFHDISERKKREEQMQLLLREVNHRAKNLLGVVQAIASQTAALGREDFMARFSERIQALAANQDLLVKNQWQGVGLEALVRAQLAHFEGLVGELILMEGPPLHVTAEAAQPIAMALHELTTNAAKYGALSNGRGKVSIAWDIGSHGTFHLSWIESGGPAVAPPTRRGFGTIVIAELPETQLDAEVMAEFPPRGVSWRLTCPANNVLETGSGGPRDADPNASTRRARQRATKRKYKRLP